MKDRLLEWDRAFEARRTKSFTEAMSRVASGVSIVTTQGTAGRFGLTVSSMTSVSAEPPLLLVCINRKSVARDAVFTNGRFAVSALATHQAGLAANFAGRAASGRHYEFAAEDWADLADLPRLHDCAASFRCSLESSLEFGTHTLFVGRVEQAFGGNASALVYTDRGYHRPTGLTDALLHPGTDSVLERSAH